MREKIHNIVYWIVIFPTEKSQNVIAAQPLKMGLLLSLNGKGNGL